MIKHQENSILSILATSLVLSFACSSCAYLIYRFVFPLSGDLGDEGLFPSKVIMELFVTVWLISATVAFIAGVLLLRSIELFPAALIVFLFAMATILATTPFVGLLSWPLAIGVMIAAMAACRLMEDG